MDRQRQVDALSAQIDDALDELSWQLSQGHSEGFLQVLEWYGQLHKYSISNAILIKLQRPNATVLAGYKRWLQLGFHVRQGEKGIRIRAPWLKKQIDPQTGEVRQRLVGYFVTCVWDITQTVEYPQKQPPTIYGAVPGDWHDLYEHLKTWTLAKGVIVTEEPMPHGIHGMAQADKITINERLSPSDKFLTCLHEWAHVAMEHYRRHDELSRSQRELMAESVSFLLARLYGLDNPFSRDYILHWNGTVEMLHDSMTEIHRAVKSIADSLGIIPRQELAVAA